jgi:hypothetical protein
MKAKIHRSTTGKVLGMCLAIGAKDMPVLSPDAEYVTVEMTTTGKRLQIEITGE